MLLGLVLNFSVPGDFEGRSRGRVCMLSPKGHKGATVVAMAAASRIGIMKGEIGGRLMLRNSGPSAEEMRRKSCINSVIFVTIQLNCETVHCCKQGQME